MRIRDSLTLSGASVAGRSCDASVQGAPVRVAVHVRVAVQVACGSRTGSRTGGVWLFRVLLRASVDAMRATRILTNLQEKRVAYAGWDAGGVAPSAIVCSGRWEGVYSLT